MSLRHDVAPTDVATLQSASAGALALADHLVAYRRDDASVEHVVVELRDAHRNLLARSTVAGAASVERVADELLAGARLERCSDFITDPIGRKKSRRTVASVCPAVDTAASSYERARAGAPQMAV